MLDYMFALCSTITP